MRFAPGIDILTLLDQFLSNFEKSHFFNFSCVGFGHIGAGRIFYASQIGQMSAGTHSTTPSPFQKKMEDNNSTLFESYTKICARLPIYPKPCNLHKSA